MQQKVLIVSIYLNKTYIIAPKLLNNFYIFGEYLHCTTYLNMVKYFSKFKAKQSPHVFSP